MVDAWTKTLSAVSSGWSGYSVRQKHPMSAGGQQVRVTVQAPSSGSVVLAHLSIGVQAAGINTVAVPVEIKFGGASGLTLASGAPDAVSDWANLETAQGQVLISVLDHASVASAMASNSTDGDGICHQWGAQSYDQASPGGSWNCNPATWSHAIKKIEVQTPEPPPPPVKVMRPRLHDLDRTYEADELCYGSDGIEYYALQETHGVDPVTEGFPRQHWAFLRIAIGNGYYITGLAKVGPGGLSPRQEALVWYGSQELNIGQSTRPDIPVACWANFQKWTRNDDYRFNEPCPNLTDKPHPGLEFAALGSGASYDRDLGTVLAPELKISTGGLAANCGGKITAPGSVAGLFNPQAWNWVFRLGANTHQKIELGVASADGQNALYFKREDAGSQGAWKCVVVVNGVVTEHNTNLSTGTERIWFQIAKNMDLETGLSVEGRFSIGTVSGENPPGQNVLKKRYAVAVGALPDANALMKPFFSFQNTSAANRDVWLWRKWFDLL
jgi:hypothetical protein